MHKHKYALCINKKKIVYKWSGFNVECKNNDSDNYNQDSGLQTFMNRI